MKRTKVTGKKAGAHEGTPEGTQEGTQEEPLRVISEVKFKVLASSAGPMLLKAFFLFYLFLFLFVVTLIVLQDFFFVFDDQVLPRAQVARCLFYFKFLIIH